MISRLKRDRLEARKNKDKIRVSFLTVLLSEAIAIGKTDGNRETTKKEVMTLIKSVKKLANDNIKTIRDEEKVKVFKIEVQICEEYLPKLKSEKETFDIVSTLISDMESPNIGKVMGTLKKSHSDSIDFGLVGKIVKEILG